MAHYEIPFFNFDLDVEFGQWANMGSSLADPISRPQSARTQMLYGIGAGTNLHLDALHIQSPYLDPLEFESHQFGDNAFLPNQKVQEVAFPPFDMSMSHESYEHASPRSDYSSQSGDTFSASCCTDDLHSKVMHQHMSTTTSPVMQEPYFAAAHPLVQSPQLPPGLGGGISLGVVQNFQDQVVERNHDFADSACSEPDAEGESDHDYPALPPVEPLAKRSSRAEKIHRESIAEMTQDSMSEDFEPDEEEDGDYSPRRSLAGRSRRAATTGRRHSQGRKLSSATSTGRVAKSKTRKPSNTAQLRPFPCPISQYGCTATFTSKNEWKRHVSTQHIKPGFWRCDMCPPTDPENPVYNDFNRKDLFTQHLRRMHRHHPLTISTVINEKGEPEISDEAMQVHQDRCYLVLRQNPAQSTCLFCDKRFEGAGSWEDRMEHVGAHMEKERKAGKPVVPIHEWSEDPNLRDYLEQEGLIEYDEGKWKIGDGQPRR